MIASASKASILNQSSRPSIVNIVAEGLRTGLLRSAGKLLFLVAAAPKAASTKARVALSKRRQKIKAHHEDKGDVSVSHESVESVKSPRKSKRAIRRSLQKGGISTKLKGSLKKRSSKAV